MLIYAVVVFKANFFFVSCLIKYPATMLNDFSALCILKVRMYSVACNETFKKINFYTFKKYMQLFWLIGDIILNNYISQR